MNEPAKAGFRWTVETIKNGVVVDRDVMRNLIPFEGLDYIINTALRNGTPYPAFYIGLLENDYIPVPGDTMATLAAQGVELIAYSETARPTVTLAAANLGETDNLSSRSEFTGTTNGKQARGGFICSASGKGTNTGVVVSAVRFSSPKTLDAGTILRVGAGFSIVSA